MEAKVARPEVGFVVPARSTAEFRSFLIEGEPQTPRVSIVGCPAYEDGAATADLLRGSTAEFQPGAGVRLAPRTAPQPGGLSHREFEWPLVVRRFADAAVTAFYVGNTIHYSVRSPSGAWSAEPIIDAGLAPGLAGPKAELGANDTVHLAYYGMDGTIWYRRLLRDGTLSAREQLASGVGASRNEFGAVLPLNYIPGKNTAVIIYQQGDGRLWERRVVNDGPPSAPVLVANQSVVRNAVDAQQPGADAVLDGETVRVLFIDDATRSIFSTNDRGGWQASKREVGEILGSWVRGNAYTRPDGVRVYGYIYDAGSQGGAGMNRFRELVLSGPRP